VEQHSLGGMRGLNEAAGSLAFGMRRLARATTAERSRQLARENLETVATAVDDQLRAVLGGDEPLVIVPPASLLGFPWSIVPALRGRAYSVSPSVTAWFNRTTRRSTDGPVVLVAGSQLDEAVLEIADLAQVWPAARILIPPVASVARVVATIDGARVAHLAAHHETNRDNPLFSAMRFEDGWVYGHDLLRLAEVPELVVLSACDAAQADTIGADEALGTAVAFLAAGSRTVIAASSLVPDSRATRLMMHDLHRALSDGQPPAKALALARRSACSDPDSNPAEWAAFTCFGS